MHSKNITLIVGSGVTLVALNMEVINLLYDVSIALHSHGLIYDNTTTLVEMIGVF